MWGKTLDELDPSIINRIPTRDDDNELYFPNDEYQMMPKDGYTKIFENIFRHEYIKVFTGTKFTTSMEKKYDHVFNSMPIDQYFKYKHGELPYRSIKFHNVTLPMAKVLPTATVNFTHDGPYTRVTEWKNIPNHGDSSTHTVLTYEEPCDYKDNKKERYYPVKDVDGVNRETYKKYKEMVKLKSVSKSNPQVDYNAVYYVISSMTYVTVCGSEVYLNSCTVYCVYCDVGQILCFIILSVV